jgi:hypothetical protein
MNLVNELIDKAKKVNPNIQWYIDK